MLVGLIGFSALSTGVLAQQTATGTSNGIARGDNWQGDNSQWMTIRSICHTDYEKFCAGTEPGGGKTMSCFKRNVAELSPTCRKAILASARSK
jgi:hypothetical protein